MIRLDVGKQLSSYHKALVKSSCKYQLCIFNKIFLLNNILYRFLHTIYSCFLCISYIYTKILMLVNISKLILIIFLTEKGIKLFRILKFFKEIIDENCSHIWGHRTFTNILRIFIEAWKVKWHNSNLYETVVIPLCSENYSFTYPVWLFMPSSRRQRISIFIFFLTSINFWRMSPLWCC